ncbi:MAG: TlpA family protein disulfide reductase [Rhodospirillales bacterium]|nr:TlpA family protein disulfide reductase [Rhodospirillales bacterium]MCW8861297.1 TlpA family protein disulfide reductase [Rhodospirillales bacterium]MCW9002188.1 TlpA family protein disulfide reductase [Rhodospirillales bacterium]
MRVLKAGVVTAFAVVLIVAISAPLSRADAAKGVSGEGGLEFFEATHPPVPAPKHPFYQDGEVEKTLADYNGKVIVLNFWAMWCAPCVREMPSLDRLQGKLSAEGVEVIALSLDRGGASVVRGFYETREIKNLAIMVDKGRKLTREAGVDGLPTTIIIDRLGNEVGRLKGPAEWDSPEAIALIRSYLGKPEGTGNSGGTARQSPAAQPTTTPEDTGVMKWLKKVFSPSE